jgi:hypothetical protein
LNQLAGLLKAQNASKGVYPYRYMSQEMLEQAALRPHKFLSLLQKFDSTALLQPAIKWSLPLPNTETFAAAGVSSSNLSVFTEVQLAMGGNFFFTVFGGCMVQLWELDPFAGPSVAPQLISELLPESLCLKDGEVASIKRWHNDHGAGSDGGYLEIYISDSNFR